MSDHNRPARLSIAKTAGFCFGVSRAIAMTEAAAREGAYAIGTVIHNTSVVESLEAAGLHTVGSTEEVPAGTTAVIRAHGECQAVYAALAEKQVRIVDTTCPCVRRIHNIVFAEAAAGRRIIVIGQRNHPETIAISDRAADVVILSSPEEVELYLHSPAFDAQKPCSIVAQTTSDKEIWKKSIGILENQCTNLRIFDTICSATDERQKAAAELASRADCMIVIGAAESSNTKKLYELCSEHCENTVAVENDKELKKYIKQGKFPAFKKLVGITAGASTPDSVIKEVYLTMAENNEMNFAEALEETLKPIKSGEVVKGVVIGVTPTEVRVDIGNKYDGVIPLSELTDDTNADINDLVKVGEEVEVYVVHVSDRDGVVTLSKKKIDAVKGMEELKTAFENNEILTGRVIELVKGGVVSIVNCVRVFIPASECAERFLADLGVLLGTEQKFRIIKMDVDRRGRQRVVGSIKSVAKEESEKAAAEFWANAEEGKQYTGTVKSLTSLDRKSTRLNSSHTDISRMPSSA